MALVRIVQRIKTIVSTDLDQFDRQIDDSNTLDDTSQVKSGVVFTTLSAGGAYVAVPLPNGISRIGWIKIETDAPILCRLNGAGEFPITPLITPALAPGSPTPGPTVVPNIQKGYMTMRAGVNADGNTVSLTSVELRSPGSSAAAVEIAIVGE